MSMLVMMRMLDRSQNAMMLLFFKSYTQSGSAQWLAGYGWLATARF